MRRVFIDTETTGLDDTDRVIELAVVSENGEVLLNTLVHSDDAPANTAFFVNGITEDDLASDKAMSVQEVESILARILDGAEVVAHSANFDRKMLEATFPALTRIRASWVCTRLIAKMREPDASAKLAAVASRLGVPVPEVQHRALADAQLALAVFKALAPTTTEVFEASDLHGAEHSLLNRFALGLGRADELSPELGNKLQCFSETQQRAVCFLSPEIGMLVFRDQSIKLMLEKQIIVYGRWNDVKAKMSSEQLSQIVNSLTDDGLKRLATLDPGAALMCVDVEKRIGDNLARMCIAKHPEVALENCYALCERLFPAQVNAWKYVFPAAYLEGALRRNEKLDRAHIEDILRSMPLKAVSVALRFGDFPLAKKMFDLNGMFKLSISDDDPIYPIAVASGFAQYASYSPVDLDAWAERNILTATAKVMCCPQLQNSELRKRMLAILVKSSPEKALKYASELNDSQFTRCASAQPARAIRADLQRFDRLLGQQQSYQSREPVASPTKHSYEPLLRPVYT